MMFSVSLHAGEVETIMLADEIKADLVIIDDSLARKYALQAGLVVTGTMGILMKAKKASLVEAIKPLLDKMIDNGVYINKRLYNDILDLANE
jgi:predicted nucleic acid-binding protein